MLHLARCVVPDRRRPAGAVGVCGLTYSSMIRFSDDRVIVRMRTNPKPDQTCIDFDGQCTVTAADTGRPEPADLLQTAKTGGGVSLSARQSSCRPALGCFPEALHRLPSTTGWQSASQLARATGAEICKCLLSEPIEPARFDVPIDPLVETSGLEFLEPRTELRELIGRQFGYGFFDVPSVVMVAKVITFNRPRHRFARLLSPSRKALTTL